MHSVAQLNPSWASGNETGNLDRLTVQNQTQRTVGINHRLQPAHVVGRIVDELLPHGFVKTQCAQMIRRVDRDAIAARHVPVAVAELVKHPSIVVPFA